MKLRIISPEPASSTSAERELRRRSAARLARAGGIRPRRGRAAQALVQRRRFDACSAGTSPNTTPASSETSRLNARMRPSTETAIRSGT